LILQKELEVSFVAWSSTEEKLNKMQGTGKGEQEYDD
jgi:hypothetical protein